MLFCCSQACRCVSAQPARPTHYLPTAPVQYGADAAAVDTSGATPMDLAVEYDCTMWVACSGLWGGLLERTMATSADALPREQPGVACKLSRFAPTLSFGCRVVRMFTSRS